MKKDTKETLKNANHKEESQLEVSFAAPSVSTSLNPNLFNSNNEKISVACQVTKSLTNPKHSDRKRSRSHSSHCSEKFIMRSSSNEHHINRSQKLTAESVYKQHVHKERQKEESKLQKEQDINVTEPDTHLATVLEHASTSNEELTAISNRAD